MSGPSPSVSAPQQQGQGLANGIPADFSRNDSHGRKPSVVISATGATGQIPNGVIAGQNARHNIAFGSMMGNNQLPSAANNQGPYQSQNNGLANAQSDPRIPSPAPIPQPLASGGKPPAALPSQANGLVFGSSNMDTPGSYAPNLRRESSQSTHSVGFMGPNSRGARGHYSQNQQYGAHGYSPVPANRQAINNRVNMSSPYPGAQAIPNSAYNNQRMSSPMMAPMPANMAPQGMAQGMYPAGGYGQPMQYAYDYPAGYYQPFMPAPYYPPQSPRPTQQYPVVYGGPPAGQSPYQPPPIPMSRNASQMSLTERPGSGLASRPVTTASNAPSVNTPAPATPAAPPSSTFQIPTRAKSKAIVIKNAQGEEVHFEKKVTPATATTASPVTTGVSPPVVAPVAQPTIDVKPAAPSPTPTPPPRTSSVSTASGTASRTESRITKTDEEIKTGFQEQVKKQIEAQKELERKQRGENSADAKAADDASTISQANTQAPASNAPAPAGSTTPTEQKPKTITADSKSGQESEPTEQKPDTKVAKPDASVQATDEGRAPAENTDGDESARRKREEDERIEREIAEMEAAEREEEERERAYAEKKARETEERKKLEAAQADEEMKRLEREAEELEAKREKERAEPGEDTEQSKADQELFSSLKRSTFGPSANLQVDTSSNIIAAEETMSPLTVTFDASATSPQKSARPKPAHLKLKTDKAVEPAQPTPGMQALRTARLLDPNRDSISYPDGILSPNPAINQAAKQRGRAYDKAFLLQFQNVFKEKPTVDWDQKIKDTLGDTEPGSARPSSSRQNSVSMSRQPSNRPQAVTPGYGGPMGSFGGPSRTLPSGTTSAERFNASQGGARPSSAIPGGFGSRAGAFPMGQSMSRSGSLQPLNQAGNPPSPRPGQSKGKGGSRRGPDRAMSRKEDEQSNKAMPLTAGLDVGPLERSSTGWTPRSITQSIAANAVAVDGSLPPEMVQRKVQGALNKMTPQNFATISDQIMVIANQSRKETDGRTLRQVIQLTFEKACDEAHWASTYANFCQRMLTTLSNDIVDETIRGKDGNPVTGTALFRKYLLNRCQEEFEAAKPPELSEEAAVLLSDEYYKVAAIKRRGLGLIQFIGELYKLGMLSKMIMHKCVLRLLDFEGQPDESTVENVCKLLRTIGATMEGDEQGAVVMEVYFKRIQDVLDQHKDLPSRLSFMLMDLVDLRKGRWKNDAAAQGPKTIQEIHQEAEAAQLAAEAERQRQNSRGGGRLPPGRGDSRSFSSQGMPPPDYNRNQVGMDDLRRLQNRNNQSSQQRQMSQQGLGPSLGPGSSLFASGRSASGRKGLGPPRDSDVSGNTSRTNTPPMKKEEKEVTPQANAFSALAALDNDGDMVKSPPSAKASPAVTVAVPAGPTTDPPPSEST